MAKRKDPGLLPELARPERYHHGDLRAALLEGALKLLDQETHETHAFSLRTVARAVGVSPAAVYHHFRDIRALLAAVAEDGLRRLTLRLKVAAAQSDAETAASPEGPSAHQTHHTEQTARRMVDAYLAVVREGPARYRVIFDADLAPRSRFPRLAAAEAALHAELVALTRALALAPTLSARTAESRAWGLWALLHGAAELELQHRGEGPTSAPETATTEASAAGHAGSGRLDDATIAGLLIAAACAPTPAPDTTTAPANGAPSSAIPA